jgi:hypothetical protein
VLAGKAVLADKRAGRQAELDGERAERSRHEKYAGHHRNLYGKQVEKLMSAR